MGYVQKMHKHEPTVGYFYLGRNLAKCMMGADAINFHVDPVRMEMTGTQQILILHFCKSYDNESKQILADKKISQVCSTDQGDSEIVIVDKSSKEEGESEIIHKSIIAIEEKDAIDETEHEEPFGNR